MGLIREPKNVDFYVDPTPLTQEDKQMIHEAIAYYNVTGKIKPQALHKKAIKPKRNKKKYKLAA
jgi:hypothetical protein